MSGPNGSKGMPLALIWAIMVIIGFGGSLVINQIIRGQAEQEGVCKYLEAEVKDNLCVKDGVVVYERE